MADPAVESNDQVAALLALLAMGLAAMASAEAAPFAYVTNGSNNVSVIDMATNTVVGKTSVVGTPIQVGNGPQAVAVASDGKHAYHECFRQR
jgi:hypothetical protein